MTSTGRATALWLTSLLITVTGCAAPNPARPATTQPVPRPVPETVTVELDVDRGPFAHRAGGFLRPTPATPLPPDRLAALGPVARARDGGPPSLLVTVGELVKFDGAFPGENGDWARWETGVEELLRKHQVNPHPRVYEIWKEPDKAPFKDRLDFFSAWVHTARTIRRLDPGAVLMGPGISKNDGGWVGEFLKVAKEYDVQPDVVCWHEDSLKHDIAGHVGGMGETFWNDGSAREHVVIMPSAAIEAKSAAGDPPIFLAQMEKAARDQGWRPFTQQFGFKLTHLFGGDHKPRPIYYSYKAYADLPAGGRVAKLTASDTIDGLAIWDAKSRTARLLLGRNRTRADAKRLLGPVTLRLKGARGATAHVSARRIANDTFESADGPTPAFEREFPLESGGTRIELPDFASGNAYVLEINVRGTPTTTTAPTTTTVPSTNISERPR